MSERTEWVKSVDECLTRFISSHSQQLAEISPLMEPFAQIAAEFFRGGKKFRAQCLLTGFRSVSPHADAPPSLVDIASALELFHGAALVHDDIMDRSDTRRGSRSVHKEFEELHRTRKWAGDEAHFGASAALLFGDLLLSWSDELFARALMNFPEIAARASRAEFDHMRWDVTAGQYLDIVEENAWPEVSVEQSLERAERVVIYKSAKYSVEAPLLIGAALAGAPPAHLEALSQIGIALGTSFQLRDDLLGVFGDATVTGKPSGDDLREGKRTLLIAFAFKSCSPQQAKSLNSWLGDASLGEQELRKAQQLLSETGAAAQIELLIARNTDRARSLINSHGFDPQVVTELNELADKLVTRVS